MGHNPISREMGYVPNFPVMSRNSVSLSIGNMIAVFKKRDFEVQDDPSSALVEVAKDLQ